MSTTPILDLTEWAAAQASPWVAHNVALRWLEFFAAGGGIADRDDTAPPGSPTDGEAYLVAASATGDWATHDGELALYISTGWVFKAPTEGMRLYVNDEDITIVYDGASWAEPSGGGGSSAFKLVIACSDESTPLTTGTAKATFRMPGAVTLTAVRASLTTAQSSGSVVTVDVNEGGTTILSTKVTLDNGEKTSTSAATAAVISDTALADDAEITIDVDQVGDGTATGLKVTLIGTYSA